MAIGRISGSVLKSNLTRNGVDLAFETNLLYLDVTNSRVGIGTSEPTSTLHINGDTTITGDLLGVTDITASGTTQTDIIKNRQQLFTTSNVMKFNQLYTGAAAGSYFSANEYQKVVTITPSGDSQNYQVIGRITAQNAGETHVVNFNAALRSNTLPDLDWTILYDEEYNGSRYIDPQLWTKETTTAGFIFAFKTLATIYGTVTVDFDVIPRNSTQLDNVSINTTQNSEQTSVDAGFTANDMTRVVRKVSSAVNVNGSVTATSFAGDGSALTNVPATLGDLTATGSTLQSPSNANIVLDPGGTGKVVAQAELVVNTLSSDDSTAIQVNDSIDMGGSIIPRADNTYNLGSPTSQWAALYVTGSTIYLGDLALSADTGTNSLKVLKKKAGKGKQDTSIADDYESTSVETAGVGDLVITGSTISAPSNADITITNSGTGAVNVDSNKIINLGTPTADTDAATKVYVDDSVAAVSTTSIAQLNSSVAVTDSGTNGTITVTADGNTELVINDTSATFSGQLVASNALSVTGNITVTGTVDGRDVATDGTKLDGIESAATADQTASEILTAIKTVDGTGSGLDADTVDGVEASALATLTGAETLTNKTLTSPQINTQIDLLAQAQIRFQDAAGGQYVGFKAPATVASNIMWTLPDSDGTSGQVLSTDGAGTFSWADGGGGGSGASYPNSTISTMPGSNGDYDLAKNAAQTTQETPFEAGGTDAFGVNLGTVFDMMDPIGTTETLDLGSDEAYVGA